MKTYLAIDTETTGFINPEVIQFAYILFNENAVLGCGNSYFLPSSKDKMETGAEIVHGLTYNKLKSLTSLQVKDNEKDLKFLLPYCDVIVGHNVNYDLQTIQKAISPEVYQMIESKEVIDTCYDFKNQIGVLVYDKYRRVKVPKLEEVISKILQYYSIEEYHERYKEIFDVDEISAHDARYDTFSVFMILKLLNKWGC